MAYVPTRFYSGQPGTTDTLLATVTTGKSWIVKQVILTNTDAAAKRVTIGFPASTALAAANHVVSDVTLNGKGLVILDMSVPLAAGETIHGLQETATAITVNIVGVEY